MEMCLRAVLLTAATWQLGIGLNLVRNPSFEEELVTEDWKTNGFTMERTQEDSYDGTFALNCTQRDRDQEGPIQLEVNVEPGTAYTFQGYVKLLSNAPGRLWQPVLVVLQLNITGGSPYKPYYIVSNGFATQERGWYKLEGSVETPNVDFTHPRLAIRGPAGGINMLVDKLLLEELPPDKQWRSKAYVNIDKIRKANINFDVTLPSGVGQDKVVMSLSLKNHQFGFGSKLEDSLIVEEPMSDYFKLVKYLFNWATLQSYKWNFDKSENPSVYSDYNRTIQATDRLILEGFKVRAHTLIWDKEKSNPDWVKTLNDNQVLPELQKRVKLMIGLTKNKVVQWDVQNEFVRHHYFEERLGQPQITESLFATARQVDPDVALFLNDYEAAGSGAITKELVELAEQYLAKNIPLDGLGLQSHVKEFVLPHPAAIWRRLDQLETTGLDLVVTEFDIQWPDVVERADALEDAMRIYFSHSGVSAFTLWGFWNKYMRLPADMELVYGNDLQILEPGERWACLVKKEWTTQEKRDLQAAGQFNVRGFKGQYELLIERNGVPVELRQLTLGDSDLDYKFTVTSNTDPIALPAADYDYVPDCVSHRGQVSLGSKDHLGSDASLTCTTRTNINPPYWSGLNEDDTLSAQCADDEVMTSCFSFNKEKANTRKGEMVVMETGQPFKCVAVQGREAKGGVKPYARCCKVKFLSCEYMKAGPSSHFNGAKTEVQCDVSMNKVPMGCSSYSRFPDFDGVLSSITASTCRAQSGAPTSTNPAEQSGSVVYAACCQAPGLECVLKHSKETPPVQRKHRMVACDAGWVLTGCNVLAEDGNAGGVKIIVKNSQEYCRAFMGLTILQEGARGAVAVATCCRVSTA